MSTISLTGLVSALQGAGLTQLVNVAATVNGTTVGQSLLADLTSGNAYTIFAPSNDAWSSAPSNITSNANNLADVFSYHVLPGNLSAYSSPYPNVTLARTLYDDPLTVHLEGGKAQVVAWATRGDNETHVLNQPANAIVQSTATYGNLTLLVVDRVLNVPGNLSCTVGVNPQLEAAEPVLKSATLAFYNETSAVTSDVTFYDALNEGYHGFTLFYPNNAAIGAANSTFASIANNRTALNDVLFNHIINGTSVYSPYLEGSQEYTTTAGETLSFSVNATGQYVTRGNYTARIVQPDILLTNGVIHVIDAVLADTENDPQAGSAALSSALSAATVSEPTQTAPIGFAITSSLAAAASSAAGNGNGAGSTTAIVVGGANGGSGTTLTAPSGTGAAATTVTAFTASGTDFPASGAVVSVSTASDGSVVTILAGGAVGGTTTLSAADAAQTSVSTASDGSVQTVVYGGAGGGTTTLSGAAGATTTTATTTPAAQTSVSTASDGSVQTVVFGGAGGGTTTLGEAGATTTTTTMTSSSAEDAGATTTTTTSTMSTSTGDASATVNGGVTSATGDANGAVAFGFASRSVLGLVTAVVCVAMGGVFTAL